MQVRRSRRQTASLHLRTTITMATPRDLTKGQKETLKKLLLKQKEWEKNKKMIKTAKKPVAKTKKA